MPFEESTLQQRSQLHRRAKRMMLIALRDTPGYTSPERVLVGWLTEGDVQLTRDAVESLLVDLEDLALVERQSTECGDVLTLTHRGWEVSRGIRRVPSIESLDTVSQQEGVKWEPAPTFVSLFETLFPKAEPFFGWRWPWAVGGLAAAVSIVVAVRIQDQVMSNSSLVVLALCLLLVVLVDTLLVLPQIRRPGQSEARRLDNELSAERALIASLAGVSPDCLQELADRLSVDIEARQSREKLLVFGAAASVLLLATVGGLWGEGSQ